MNFKLSSKMLFFVWILLTAAGFGSLTWYKQLPGPVGMIQKRWPQNIEHIYSTEAMNLVLFAHPLCPCSRATMTELEQLLQNHPKLNARIFLYHPADQTSAWSNGSIKDDAKKIKNLEVIDDPAGINARRFGALTSGQAMLYGKDGKLAFAGGLTNSRGHIGEAAGSRSIASVIESGKTIVTTTPAYGCTLFSAKELQNYKSETVKGK